MPRSRTIRTGIVSCLAVALMLVLPAALPALENSQGTDYMEFFQDRPVITRLSVHVPPQFEDAQLLSLMARDLLFLKEGDAFSTEAFEQSLAALELSGRFAEISVDSEETDDTFIIHFELTPAPLVRDIRMSGLYPFFERDIRAVMTLRPGDPVTASILREQERLITAFYEKEGFIRPAVTVEALGDPKERALSLRITISKGPWYRLRDLAFSGNRYFSDTALRTMARIQRSRFLPGSAGRFSDETLAKDMERLLQHYREAGFAECTIRHDIHKDPQQGDVSVTVTVQEGPRYDVKLTGNQALSLRELEQDFLFLRQGNRNDGALNRTLRNMTNRYRSQGFPDARIVLESETTEQDGAAVRTIRFFIDEGTFHRVGRITIDGAEAIEESTVRQWLRGGMPDFREGSPWISEQAEGALFTIASAYKALGFLEAEVAKNLNLREDDRRRTVDVALNIAEGVRTLVSSVTFTGFRSITGEEASDAAQLKAGVPLKTNLLEEDRRALSALISEKGHPHVRVREHLRFSDDRSSVDVEYQADEGPRVTLGNVYYRGNFRTKERVFRRTLELRTGDPFSPSRYLQGERTLRNLDVVESARFRAIGLAEKTDEVTLLVDLEEKKPYFFEAGFGYESQRGVYADATVGDRNLFGTNRSGWIGSEVSETGYRTEAALADPRFLGYSVNATAGIYQERQELFNQTFGTDTYGASLRFSRKLSPQLGAHLGTRFEQRKLFGRGGGSIPAGSEELYNSRSILVLTPSLIYDTRDFFIRPRSGAYGVAALDLSKGVRNSFDDFLKYDLDLRYFRSPFHRLTLALLARAAFLQSFGPSGLIPEDQLLFLGGTSSVRGFAENKLRSDAKGNPLGGRLSLSGSLEARIDLGGNWELTTFFDTGSLSRTLENVGTGGFRSSIGAGIRYITPIGPMGILYGSKLDRRDGEGAGRWHFSIGYTF